jgi:hypothetical protein
MKHRGSQTAEIQAETFVLRSLAFKHDSTTSDQIIGIAFGAILWNPASWRGNPPQAPSAQLCNLQQIFVKECRFLEHERSIAL